jgi:hypothetical protein
VVKDMEKWISIRPRVLGEESWFLLLARERTIGGDSDERPKSIREACPPELPGMLRRQPSARSR